MDKGITTKKSDNFNEWYQQIVTKGEFIMTAGIDGCYVMLPNGYGMWEHTQGYMDKHFKSIGVKNMYFPIFIKSADLEREKDHLDGFNPEVAWVTQVGTHELKKCDRLAIRPTSECGIYPIFSKLIRSHVDLPFKANQWCNVVRWEFKDATPFIRSREFLWQEGHTCHATAEGAEEEVLNILEFYNMVYTSVLAVPVIKGLKTEKEKFSGADKTYTVETFIGESGKAIQAATAHCLGQNFSKIFDIKFQDRDTGNKYVYQNSWGFTTRSIGVALMTHGDDNGAIVPPFVSNIQIVVVPIYKKKDELENIIKFYDDFIKPSLENYRVTFDGSNKKPGAKFNYWERIGVPIRIEIGGNEIKNNILTVHRRDTKVKETMALADLYESLYSLMVDITMDMYAKTLVKLKCSISVPTYKEEFFSLLNEKTMCLIQWCNTTECEDKIKEETGAKSLCIPMDDDYKLDLDGTPCMFCTKPTSISCLFGRSF